MNEIIEFFFIGYAGEKNARRKPIDISDLQTRWPEATPILMVNRPKETAPYPATTTVEGSMLYWEVAEIDVAKSGFGQAQVFMRDSDENVLGKSAVMNTLVKTSLNGTEQENPPPALETWIAKFLEAYEGLGGGNNSGGSSVAIDTTLTQPGEAADAKATGDALKELKEAIDEELDSLNEQIANLGGGMSSNAATLLIAILRGAVYDTDQSANIEALKTALESGELPDTPTGETIPLTVIKGSVTRTDGQKLTYDAREVSFDRATINPIALYVESGKTYKISLSDYSNYGINLQTFTYSTVGTDFTVTEGTTKVFNGDFTRVGTSGWKREDIVYVADGTADIIVVTVAKGTNHDEVFTDEDISAVNDLLTVTLE